MGKNKDKKKKGLGMEKTLAKTEKKQQKLLKKELEDLGEVNVFITLSKSINSITKSTQNKGRHWDNHIPNKREGKRVGTSERRRFTRG